MVCYSEEALQQFCDSSRVKYEILGILDQIATMGANDFEFAAIYDILGNLENIKITPKEALVMAMRVLDSKQDYH